MLLITNVRWIKRFEWILRSEKKKSEKWKKEKHESKFFNSDFGNESDSGEKREYQQSVREAQRRSVPAKDFLLLNVVWY